MTRILLSCLLLACLRGEQLPAVAAIAHRGEHRSHPENTLAAYRAAWEAGADYFETDVRTTLDGKLVIMHDSTVDRGTGGRGEVARLTLKQIRGVPGGHEIPTLDEVLQLAQGRIGVYVDAKQASAADLVEALTRHKMASHVVVYGNPGLLKGIGRLDVQIRVMPEAVSTDAVRRSLLELRPKVFAFDARDFQDEVISLVRKAGAEIFVDPLGASDTPENWEDAVRRGATGIQTDRPAELVQFLRGRGLHK